MIKLYAGLFRKEALRGGALFLLTLFLLISIGSAEAQQFKDGVLQGSIRVKFVPELVEKAPKLKSVGGVMRTGNANIDLLNAQIKVHQFKRVIPYSEKFDARHRKYGLHQWYEIRFDKNQDVKSVLTAYSHLAEIELAEPIYEKRIIPYSIGEISKDNNTADLKNANQAIFNDPLLEKQWHYINEGQSGGTPGADVNVKNVWQEIAGSSNIIVSIHDQGVDYNHIDLKNNMWVNEAELNGEEGVDDDGNGFEDDIYGYNFGDNKPDILIGYHGTHVAGTVAAENNNGIGVAGIAGGTGNDDGVRLMTCDIFGNFTAGNIAGSFVYAADNGAVISQNSWGYSSPGVYEQLVHDAIDYFIAEAGNYQGSPMKGGVVIFASGNDNSDEAYYPNAYKSVLSVGAVDHNDIKAEYSNHHESVDFSAHGGETSYGSQEGVFSTMPEDNYGFLHGTSMACPHVSGVAALIVSKYQSEEFKNTDLVHRLITGTRDIYTIKGNEAFAGMMGVGIIDAELGMKANEEIAPEDITDLELVGIGQDFASLRWTVPADGDNGQPDKFIVYFSEYSINDNEIAKASKVTINNDSLAGSIFEYELTGLKPTTTYNIAVVSEDRWLIQSGYSNVVSGSTNDGPEVHISVENIDFGNLGINQDHKGQTEFTISNTGDGLLKWNAEYFHSQNVDTYNPTNIVVHSKAFIKNPFGPRVYKVEARKAEIVTYEQKKDETNWIDYLNPYGGSYIMGEEDLSISNSAATRFYVDDEEGFNLTNLGIGINLNVGEQGELPVVEVFRGKELTTAQKVLSHEFTPSSPMYLQDNITLNDQIYFSEGEYFWLVVHIPACHLYPLSIGFEQSPEYSDNCLMSFDKGLSWHALESVIDDDRFVLDMAAGGLLKPLHKYIQLNPESGVVTSSGAQNVKVNVDVGELINGEYNAALLITTNESQDTLHRIAVEFEVNEHDPVMKSVDILDFGTVFHGESKLLHMELANRGYGAFVSENETIFNAVISDPQFKIENDVKSPIKGMQSAILSIRYTPDKVSNTSATVTFNDKYGNTYTFNVYGAGIEPAKAVVTPPSNDFTGLSLGDMANGSLTLSNEGAFPLKYYVPGFADGTNLGQVNDTLSCKAGYTFTITEGDKDNPGFVWEDISKTGTPLFQFFEEDSRENHYPVALDFIFPFFGEHYDTLYITRRSGLLSFDKESRFNTWPNFYHYEYNHDRFISAWGRDMFNLANNEFGGDVFYQQYPDRLIVQYHRINEGLNYTDIDGSYSYWNEPLSFQIIIYDNGDIDFNYLNLGEYPPVGVELSSYYSLLAIEDYVLGDGLYMNGFIHGFQLYNEQPLAKYPPKTGYKYSIKSPGLGIMESVSPAFGTVQAGESVTIDYTMDTEDLYVGEFAERMTIVTNDPFNNPSFHEANINIVNGGTANIELSATELDFGQVFQRDTVTIELIVKNTGKAIVDFESVISQNGHYTIDGYMPVVLKPRNKSRYTITIVTEEMGIKDDGIIFTDSDGNTYEVTVTGEVIEAPLISTDPISYSEAQGYNSTQTKPLNVINTGLSPMEFTISGEEWLSIYPKGHTSYTENVGYEVSKLVDKETKLFNWEDVRSLGDTIEFTGDIFKAELFWREVPLPFNFSYYGVEYDTMHVGHSGLISFTRGQESYAWGPGPNEYAPTEGGLTNYMAPFFGFVGMADRGYFPDAGVYVHGNEERIIVQFHEYMNLFGMGDPLSFQVVLFRNGSFKFMYDFYSEDAWMTSEWGAIGFENQDGTKGNQLTYRDYSLKDGLIYTMAPKESYSVAASSTAEFDVIFDSRTLFDGTYSGHIHIDNNTPDASEYKVPVDFTIQGTAQYTIEGSLELDSLMIVPEEGDYRTYDHPFTFHNTGTKDMTVNAVRLMSAAPYGGALYADDAKYGSGDAEDGWFNVSRRPLNTTLRPRQSEKLNLRLRPTTEGFYRDTVLVYSDMSEIAKIPIEVSYYGAPKITVSSDDMYVYADADTEEAVRNITISNANGLTNLHYSIDMEYKREVAMETYSMPSTQSVLKMQSATDTIPTLVGKTGASAALKSSNVQDDNYNRVLFYSDKRAADGQIGYNGNGTFHAVVGYTAPSDGFNLTHVQTHYTWFDHLQSEITVQIRRGSAILEETSIVYSQDFTHVAQEESEDGGLITIELDGNQLIYPNERFFIVIKYPQVVPFPQGYVFIDEEMENTFFHGNGVDFAETRFSPGFEKAANLIIACEDEYKLSGWAQVDVETEGIIARGEELVIPVTYIADQAEQGVNEATMIIETNDPKALISQIAFTLERNKGPHIQGEIKKELTIYEGLAHQIEIHAVDAEGDDFEFELDADFDFVSTEVVNGKYLISLLPGYEDEGFYAMKVLMTDSYGNTTWTKFDINVVHVNRMPALVHEIGELFFVLEREEPYQIDFSDYIVDEDGDVVNFSINYDNKSLVKVFKSGSSVMIHPLEIGQFNLIITATDPYFATYTKTVKCHIDHRTGMDDVGLSSVKIFPNPVKREMYIYHSEQQSELSRIRIISTGGSVMKEIDVNTSGSEATHKVNAADLVPGIYFVELISNNGTLVRKIVKE